MKNQAVNRKAICFLIYSPLYYALFIFLEFPADFVQLFHGINVCFPCNSFRHVCPFRCKIYLFENGCKICYNK